MIFRGVLFLGLGVLGFNGMALANDFETCRVYYVDEDYNYLEEGLGVFGRGDVDSDSQEVSFEREDGKLTSIKVGQMRWDGDDKISEKEIAGGKQFRMSDKNNKNKAQIKVYESGRGIFLAPNDVDGEFNLVAKFDCASLKPVLKSEVGAKNVEKITKQNLAKKYKPTYSNLKVLDVSTALGDEEEYELKKETYYVVFDPKDASAMVGIILVADVYDSKNKKTKVATIRFDRNGCLVSDVRAN